MKYRDPETGEFKELYTKAADTLPVGTVVDYDGDEVPAGWEKVEETGVILYDNVGGSSSNIIFEKEIKDNVKYIEIYFKDEDSIKGYTKVENPVDSDVCLFIVRLNKNYNARFKNSTVKISKTGLSIVDYGRYDNGNKLDQNDIRVTKVKAYY